jgi:hypothetical protein
MNLDFPVSLVQPSASPVCLPCGWFETLPVPTKLLSSFPHFQRRPCGRNRLERPSYCYFDWSTCQGLPPFFLPGSFSDPPLRAFQAGNPFLSAGLFATTSCGIYCAQTLWECCPPCGFLLSPPTGRCALGLPKASRAALGAYRRSTKPHKVVEAYFTVRLCHPQSTVHLRIESKICS